MTVVYLRRLALDADRTPAELTAFRSAEVRRLLADCLKVCYGECAAAWSLAKTVDGKPYLASIERSADKTEPPCISLSHSGEWVVCALSDAPVGVDVQEVRPISDGVLARFTFHTDFTEVDDRAKTRAWTRYEACLKRYGSRAAMVPDAREQCYDSRDLDDAVVTVCYGGGAVEWVTIRGRF